MNTEQAFDQQVVEKMFRSAMGHLAAAVSVVTVLDEDVPHGTTVSAVTSLSMDPPMLLVSLDKTSTLLSKLALGSRVGVNILADDQEAIAMRFAGKGDDKFNGVDWMLDEGAPALVERHAWVAIEIERLVEAGDHTLVLGNVMSAEASAEVSGTRPLTYWQKTFGTHGPAAVR